MQPHERQEARHQKIGAFGDPIQIGQMRIELFGNLVMAAEHRHRDVAEAGVFGQHRQQRLDDPRPEAVADHQPVDVAAVERAGGAFDAERADQTDPLADRDRELRIGAAATGDQHGRLVERIGIRQRRHAFATGDERFHPAQHGVVQGPDAQRGAEPLRHARGRDGGRDRQHVGQWRRPSSRVRAITGVKAPLLASRACSSALANSSARAGSPHGSARTRPSGSTEANAAAASLQLVSMIGKAPAACSASATSGAG